MSDSHRSIRGVLCIAVCFLCAVANAKIARVTLDQLVDESDIVVYGKTTTLNDVQHKNDGGVAWLRPITVLFGKIPDGSRGLPICNAVDTESLDLKANPGNYVLFVKRSGQCYSPVAGLKAVVPVVGALALTGRIDAEPERMKLKALFERIRARAAGKSPK
jgi:hypothetical protein